MGCTIIFLGRIAFGDPMSEVENIPATGPKLEVASFTCNGSRHTNFDRLLRTMNEYILMGCTINIGEGKAFGCARSKDKSIPATVLELEIYRFTCNGSRHIKFDRLFRTMDQYI
jgi:hypothetical protein